MMNYHHLVNAYMHWDERYRSHSGIDVKSLLVISGALMVGVLVADPITQQLAKCYFRRFFKYIRAYPTEI